MDEKNSAVKQLSLNRYFWELSTYPFRELVVHHEVVYKLFVASQLEFMRQNRHDQSRAKRALNRTSKVAFSLRLFTARNGRRRQVTAVTCRWRRVTAVDGRNVPSTVVDRIERVWTQGTISKIKHWARRRRP